MRIKLIILLLFISGYSSAQLSTDDYRRNLSKMVSLTIHQERVDYVLETLSKAGGFYFSYNGTLVKQDSLVNINVKNVPVRQVLDQLFDGDVDYKENSEYIILRYAVNHLNIEAANLSYGNNEFTVSGYVIDTKTGNYIKQASVYEKQLLQVALTDHTGYFSLRFKGEYSGVILTASKETYRDTALVFLADVKVKPIGYEDPNKEKGAFFSKTFGSRGIWRFLLTSKQKSQNANLPNFLARTPFQASFLPGLSSHGSMSSSVVNKVSLNIIGGYTAGTNGFELAGTFNLTKGNIKNVQTAGLFNVVGGSVQGVQIAGAYNDVNENIKGVQVAGVINRVEGNVDGLQLAGAINIAGLDLNGTQVGGLINWSKNTTGIQIGGLINKTTNQLKGLQVSGLINYAKRMNGFQVGIINLADTATGISLGLINWSKNGYRKLNFYTNEIFHNNIALKTGNQNLYSLLIVGNNFSDTARVFTFGLGLGHEFNLNKRFAIGLEGIIQSVYLGNWEDFNSLYRIQTNFQFNAFKKLTFFAGPAYSYYTQNISKDAIAKNYKKELAPAWHHRFKNNAQGWLGWNLGVSISL